MLVRAVGTRGSKVTLYEPLDAQKMYTMFSLCPRAIFLMSHNKYVDKAYSVGLDNTQGIAIAQCCEGGNLCLINEDIAQINHTG